MSEIGLKLKGEFKFDLYDSGRNLLYSSSFMDNFITNSGIRYPYYFAFADCFRYLSVGSGTVINSIIKTGISNPETTGLQIPISGYTYIGGRPSASTTTSNYSSPGCGYNETISGIDLFRQWTLPSNTSLFSGNQTFNEFMVSPGQPYVTGITGQKLCTCDEGDGHSTFGNDCSSVAMYYNWVQDAYASIPQFRPKMCDAILAFARVVFPISVVTNSYLNITYRLSISPNTGISSLSLNNSVGVNTDPNWSGKLNSIFKVTQPGIKLINDGVVSTPTAPNGQERLQHFDYTGQYNGYDFTKEYGESFVPPMGMPLEPSNLSIGNSNPPVQNIMYYVSSDNTEFLVSTTGVFSNTGQYAPWVPSSGAYNGTGTSGLAPYLNNNSVILSQGTPYWSNNPNTYNIRTNSNVFPNTGDITQVNSSPTFLSYAAPFDSISQPQLQLQQIPIISGYRTGQVTYSFSFPRYPGGFTFPVKSFVAGYIDIPYALDLGYAGDDTNMVPFFDCIFSGTGKIFIPHIITGGMTYPSTSSITGAAISGAGDFNYFYLINGNGQKYPIFDTILTWSAPCPPGVTGC